MFFIKKNNYLLILVSYLSNAIVSIQIDLFC